jgi:hypothetical protein
MLSCDDVFIGHVIDQGNSIMVSVCLLLKWDHSNNYS